MKRTKNKDITRIKNKPSEKSNVAKSFPFNIWLLVSLIFIVGIIVFSKYLTAEYLFFFKDIGSDSINQIYPGIEHKINMMPDGFFTKWSFYKGMGDKFIGGYPVEPYGFFRRVVDFIGAKMGGVNYFVYGRFTKIFIFNFIFSGVLFFYYLRTISINKFSALIGALFISFSGYMVVGSGWGFSAHIFKASLLLFSFEQLYVKKRWYFMPIAIIWLSSNIFILYVYALFLLFYSTFRFFSEKNTKFIDFVKLQTQILLLGTVALLMKISTLVRSFIGMFNSPRVSGNASYSQALSNGNEIIEQTSLTATTILRFFSSDILGTGSNFKGWSNYLEAPLFYIGILTLLLAPQVFIHLNKRKKITFAVFSGFWVLTLVFPYLRHTFLAFTGDYFRYGFDFFIPFTLLFFAVYALNEIDKNFKLNLPLLGGTLVVLLIALFFPYNSLHASAINNSLQKTIVILLFVYSILVFLMSKPKYKSYAQIGILLMVVFELSYFSYKSYEDRVPVTKKEFKKSKGGYADGTIKAVNYIKSLDKSAFYRIEKDYQSGNTMHASLNDAKAQGYYGTTSYSSFNQLNYVRFLEEVGLIQKGDENATRWITGFRDYPLLQSFANIKYHLSKNDKPLFLRFGFKPYKKESGINILKNPYYLPFGYTYDKYIEAKDFKELVNYKISKQSLTTIQKDLSRSVLRNELNNLLTKLQTIENKKFSNLNLFDRELKKLLDENSFKKYHLTIAKYSVFNFMAQVALLNGFVYEKDELLKVNNIEKIDITDENKITPVEKFNFKIYKTLTDNLKQDTLQITSFKNSEIKGNINLQKSKLLFFTIPYDEGWKVLVNGKEKTLSRVNFGFTGIMLPKGKHKIKLYYVPKYSTITTTISIISVIGFWFFLFFYIYKKRKTI